MKMQLQSFFVGGLMLAGVQVASAAPIGHWQFHDGPAGASAATLINLISPGTLDGTASIITGTGGGLLPAFSSQTPGGYVQDGLNGSIIGANPTSLRFVNTGLPTNPDGGAGGGMVAVADPGGAGSALKPSSFTIEAFILVDDHVNFPAIVTKSRADANGTSWGLDTSGNDRLRARIDSQPLGSGSGTGFNQSIGGGALHPDLLDDSWHHVAATYDENTRFFSLYVDYALVVSGTTLNPLVYDDSPLRIGALGGGRPFDGWIDEVRLTNGVLTTDQFLRAVELPEPASAGLLLLGAGVLMRRRRTA